MYENGFTLYSIAVAEKVKLNRLKRLDRIPKTWKEYRLLESAFDSTLSSHLTAWQAHHSGEFRPEANPYTGNSTLLAMWHYESVWDLQNNPTEINLERYKLIKDIIIRRHGSLKLVEKAAEDLQKKVEAEEIGKIAKISSTLKNIEEVKKVLGKCRKTALVVKKELLHPDLHYIERALGGNEERWDYFVSDAIIFPEPKYAMAIELGARFTFAFQKFDRFVQILLHSGMYGYWELMVQYLSLIKYRVKDLELQPQKLVCDDIYYCGCLRGRLSLCFCPRAGCRKCCERSNSIQSVFGNRMQPIC